MKNLLDDVATIRTLLAAFDEANSKPIGGACHEY
jgi:hypothetical protein